MKILNKIISLLIFAVFSLSCGPGSEITADHKPNIIYILADDLGYGELGCYGQGIIETPNLDQLAATGMQFMQHYTGAPVCAPARCTLLTGKHSGHAFVRGNDEWRERGEVWDFAAMFNDPKLEGQRPIPDEEITVAELLKKAGYINGCVGKWGLGAPETEGVPNRQGFDFFYGYNCQRQAHTLYPMHLWKNEERDLLNNKMVAPKTKLAEGADPNDSASYTNYRLDDYAPTLMHDEALNFIKSNHESPFFLYYASPLPHVPLQAPRRWVDYYRNKIGPEEPYIGDQGYFPCQYPRATYAAMISYLDEQVGDLMSILKSLEIHDHTLVIFSSDNGPTYTGGADTRFFDSARPFKTEYGWGKGFVHEGGIRVPMIATWPGHIEAGSKSDLVSCFIDVLPTFCDVAQVEKPQNIDGISFLPTLLNEGNQDLHEYLYWEFPEYKGQQALRMGNYKAIRKNIQEGNLEIELYDLSLDIQETNNVAHENPELIEKIRSILDQEHIQATTQRFWMKALGDTSG
ncbi:MAG: arylsulfatase [Saprospiraceae bacterium]|nr:arylsulfatase [Saprospiraceae bacterium]